MENFSRINYIAQAFANDLKHMYIHLMGKNIDSLSSYIKELWLEINNEIDDISKFIIIIGNDSVDNPNNIKSHLDFDSEWLPLTDEIITEEVFTKEFILRCTKYIIEIENDPYLPQELKYIYTAFWKGEILFNEKRSLGEY